MEEPVTRQKVPPNAYNWTAAKRMWSQGETVATIAETLGMPKASVYRKACVAKWPKRNDPAVYVGPSRDLQVPVAKALQTEAMQQIAIQAPTISAEVRKALGEWLRRVLGNANKLQDHIESALDRKIDVEEIKSLSSSLETVDRVARRTFGLDGPAGVSSVSGLALVAQPWSGSAVIDVTPEPAQLPAVVPEAPKEATK